MSQKTVQNSILMPILLIAGGVIVIFSILIWQMVGQSPTAVATQSSNANIPYANIKRVSPAEAKTALDNKTAIFVDVRDLDIYNTSHISGAVNIPLGEIETRFRELDSKQWIITYCT
jgi:3-mercaptopyruvate sulfurtransferase SseA